MRKKVLYGLGLVVTSILIPEAYIVGLALAVYLALASI